MYNDIIGKKIISITREDELNACEFRCPLGLFIEFGEGLYFGVTKDKSIDIDLITKEELTEIGGFEYSECDLNELKDTDELRHLIGERINEIKIADFKDAKIKGQTFELLWGGYAGIKLKTDNHELIFYNDNGGHLSIIDGGKIPNEERWTWK